MFCRASDTSDQWAGARAVYLMELCRLTDKYGQIRTITDDNGQQIAHCLYAGECRMVCFAARPTSPTCPTCPTSTSQVSKPALPYGALQLRKISSNIYRFGKYRIRGFFILAGHGRAGFLHYFFGFFNKLFFSGILLPALHFVE